MTDKHVCRYSSKWRAYSNPVSSPVYHLSGSEVPVEKSVWYDADPIAIAASNFEKVNRKLSVWDSIEAIVECEPNEWEEKVTKWMKGLQAQSNFVMKIPNESSVK